MRERRSKYSLSIAPRGEMGEKKEERGGPILFPPLHSISFVFAPLPFLYIVTFCFRSLKNVG